MKSLSQVFLVAGLFAAGPLAYSQQQMEIEERKTSTRSFPSARRLEVDNVFGSIRVTATDSASVEVSVVETVRARTREDATQAAQDFRLDMSQQGDTVRLFADGPFRCNCDDGRQGSRNGRRYRGYQVQYDFEIKTPRSTGLWLRTVNNGGIIVEGVAGDFDIENVNGSLDLRDISGSGRAHTVNGPVRVTFRRNPQAASSFASINGELDLVFQPGLSADLRLKTFNGRIYSDFEVGALPVRTAAIEKREGKQVFRADRFSGARIGQGGPEITLDGFNGDIRIRKGS